MIRADFYGNFFKNAFGGDAVNWLTDTINCGLCTASYPPNINSDNHWPDISTYEITGTGYTTGGQTLSGNTLGYDSVAQQAILNATQVSWGPTASFTVSYGVLYKTTGDQPLIGLVNLGGPVTISVGTFAIAWNGPLGEVTIS